jgi:hypothetical protein
MLDYFKTMMSHFDADNLGVYASYTFAKASNATVPKIAGKHMRDIVDEAELTEIALRASAI